MSDLNLPTNDLRQPGKMDNLRMSFPQVKKVKSEISVKFLYYLLSTYYRFNHFQNNY